MQDKYEKIWIAVPCQSSSMNPLSHYIYIYATQLKVIEINIKLSQL